jgi:4-amino-4-deoxy-L-arabinose transferase-like glycosyltransferase
MLARSKLPLILILLLGTTLRLISISARPIWYDEAFAILFSQKGPAAMLYGTLAPAGSGAADIHPLGYYTLLWGWMGIFGESMAASRLLSVVAGMISVLVIYKIAEELFTEHTALVSALFLAISPFQVHYSQEIRMYSFLGLWLGLATLCYAKGRRGGQARWWIGFALSAALAQYTHNLAAFYLAPLAASALLQRDWRALRSAAAAGTAAVVLYLPWLIHLPTQIAKIDQAYWVERPGPARLLTLLLTFTTNLPLPGEWLAAGLFLTLSAATLASWQTLKAWRIKVTNLSHGLWILYLSFAPPLLLYIFSQWKPVYIERALIASGMMFCIWLAWSLLETGTPRPVSYAVIGMLILAAGIGLYQHMSYAGFPYAPYRQLDSSLRIRTKPGDTIVHSSKLSYLPAIYFDPELQQKFIGDPPGSTVDTLAPATQQVLAIQAQPGIEQAASGARRVWFIIFKESIQEYTSAGEADHPQLKWLKNHFQEESMEVWGDLQVYLFTR